MQRKTLVRILTTIWVWAIYLSFALLVLNFLVYLMLTILYGYEPE